MWDLWTSEQSSENCCESTQACSLQGNLSPLLNAQKIEVIFFLGAAAVGRAAAMGKESLPEDPAGLLAGSY